jgi:hypothetical protein
MNGNLQITYFTGGCQDFEGTYCLHLQPVNVQAEYSPETLIVGTK